MSSIASRRSSGTNSRSQPLACLRCRQKRSFCSKDRPTCLACREKALECIYPEGRKVTVLASYLHDLELRLKRYEAASKSTSAGSTQDQDTSCPRETSEDNIEDKDLEVNPLMEDFATLIVSSSGKPQYLGNSSSTILGRRLRDMIGIVNLDNQAFDIDRESATYNHAALRPRRSPVTRSIRLPPLLIAKRLFSAQFTYIGTIFAFVQPDLFEKQLNQAYRGPPSVDDRDACLSYCQVLLVLAFGQLYSVNQWTNFEGPPGFEYFTHALEFLPDIHEEGSVLFVGVLALVGYFMQNLNRRDAAFLYVGNALRMAISLALHQEVSTPGLDESMKEFRRRVWWSVYSLDRILCVKSGLPVTIQDEDIGVLPPMRLPRESPHCAAVVLSHYTQLSRILGQIMNMIYRKTPKSGSTLMNAVQDIMAALLRWRGTLPKELYFDPAKLSVSRESVSTFLHYYQCINMTVRPLLFHVVQKRLQGGPEDRLQDWRQDMSPTTVKVIETCIDGARDTITMMTIAARKDLVATYGYMDGEHAFSAAVVLVMVCLAFPGTAEDFAAMDAALDLLGVMSERGNAHIAARYQLLIHMRSLMQRPNGGAGAGHIIQSTIEPLDSGSCEVPPLLIDDTALEKMLDDNVTADELDFWEEGYMNPDFDVNYDLSQWTQTAQETLGDAAI
ncbi:hypothetical protein AAFC00_005669 [Neodothiora populina]|uniref:Zn(2)-C6 fungal-type domain-containing protein n=1 Tax=Neodothiora populina TaxID=2781224 RepID=A0ABR3P5F4_9PEZI